MIDKRLIDDCVHCGFCLPACPTYDLWGEEMDSPRGRIVLMRELADGGYSPELATHLDRCLGCMACVPACPSGVKYDQLLVQARQELDEHRRRPLRETVALKVATRPGAVKALRPLGRLTPARKLVPPRPPKAGPLPAVTAAVGERRATVGLLQGCVQRALFAHVNTATARVLAAEGYEVHAPAQPRCCGSLLLHTGADHSAHERATIEALGGFDLIVTNVAGCGSGMKEYADREFAGRVRDVLELLAEHAPRAERHPVELRVAYHDACHLAHAQGIKAQPRELLRGIPGLVLLEAPGAGRCCGSAGIYNLTQPEAAEELGRRRASELEGTKPDVIAAANPGCALQIAAYTGIPVVHPIELLDRSMSGATTPGIATS